MTRALFSLLAMLLLSLTLSCSALAETAADPTPAITIDQSKLLVPPRSAKGTMETSFFWDNPIIWLRNQQRSFYGAMSGALRQIRSGSPLTAAWTLILLSLVYGVLHAAGPGHGKAVISAWLLATEGDLRRGVLVALLSALIQALTAIVVVSVLLLFLASVGSVARDIAGILEGASYLLIAGLGVYLLSTAFRRPLFGLASSAPLPANVPARTAPSALHHFDSFTPPNAHCHDHDHGPACDCTHAHLPAAKDLKGEWSFARALSLALAVGIRPCTGAILVLIFASAMGLYWAGIAATLAMSVGTFITVSAIAAIAVYSKSFAMRLVPSSSRSLALLNSGLRIGGGLFIAALGMLLFLDSLGSTNTLLLSQTRFFAPFEFAS